MAEDINNPLQQNNKGKSKFNAYWIYGLVALAILGLQFLNFGQDPSEISSVKFKEILHAHHNSAVVECKGL